MKNYIYIILLLLLAQQSYSQNLTSSPYSIFGVGEIQSKGNGWSSAMGGVGIGLKSEIGLNNVNPASYSGIDSLFFLYEIGISGRLSDFSTENESQRMYSSNLSSFAIGFQAKKWWGVSIGIAPYSKVGYEISTFNNRTVDNSVYQNTYNGSGGINQIYMGNSFQLSKNISFGINLSYLFGSLDEEEEISYNSEDVYYIITDQVNVKGLYLDYGLQVDFPMNKNTWTVGAIYGHKRYLSSSVDKMVYDNAYEEYLYEEENMEAEENYIIPRKVGVGLALSNNEGLFKAGFDYTINQWSEIEFDNSDLDTKDSHRFALGLEYTPEGRRSNKTLKRCYYRIGGYYNSSYLKVDNNSINSMALSFGLGIPVKRNLSMLNVAFEMGKMGTLNNGLVQENFYSLNLNFSLQDIWFLKQKID